MAKEKTVARLTIIVAFREGEGYPGDNELSEILDSCRNYGSIEAAELNFLSPSKRDLKKENL